MLRATVTGMALVGLATVASPCRAQRSDASRSTAPPPGAFVGVIKNSIDSTRVRSADVRLFFIDSGHVVQDPTAGSSIETFIDTTRSRLGFSDSTGAFAIWRLAAGKYLLNVRRIGFNPVEGIVTVDTGTVLFDFTMTPVSQMLSKVEITEAATNSASRRLETSGFNRRSHAEMGQYIRQPEMMKRQPQTLRDILEAYGLRESADYMLDRMPLEYEDIQDYPAEFIAGIEIYRHNRPVAVNMTRGGAPRRGQAAPSAQALFMRPLVMIWTAIP
jgi:hypothetical protein